MTFYFLIILFTVIMIEIAVFIGFAMGRKSVDKKSRTDARSSKNDVVGSVVPASSFRLSKILPMARLALSRRTEKRKSTILEMLKGEARHMKRLTQCNIDPTAQGLTSDDISLLLGVSQSTARKYLNELEKENKVLQIGTAGRNVSYVLKDGKT